MRTTICFLGTAIALNLFSASIPALADTPAGITALHETSTSFTTQSTELHVSPSLDENHCAYQQGCIHESILEEESSPTQSLVSWHGPALAESENSNSTSSLKPPEDDHPFELPVRTYHEPESTATPDPVSDNPLSSELPTSETEWTEPTPVDPSESPQTPGTTEESTFTEAPPQPLPTSQTEKPVPTLDPSMTLEFPVPSTPMTEISEGNVDGKSFEANFGRSTSHSIATAPTTGTGVPIELTAERLLSPMFNLNFIEASTTSSPNELLMSLTGENNDGTVVSDLIEKEKHVNSASLGLRPRASGPTNRQLQMARNGWLSTFGLGVGFLAAFGAAAVCIGRQQEKR